MSLSIHQQSTRFLAAVLVFVLLLLLIGPHFMDVEPPLLVRILMKPAEIASRIVGGLVPPHNIGTTESPFYEATPVHLLLGLMLVFFCILLYPFATYLLLTVLSKLVRGRAARHHRPR